MSGRATLDGKPVFVSGATSGIGLAVARRLRTEGARVFGGALAGADSRELEATGAVVISLDVTDATSVDQARVEVEKHLDGVPIFALVNCAGTMGAGAVEGLDLEVVRRVHDVNVVGTLAVTQVFLPALREARGRIVNLGSLSGLLALPFLGPYAASKFALEAWSDVLRRELYPFGVHVTVVQPGAIRTSLWDEAAAIDLSVYDGSPYQKALARVQRKAVKRGRKGMSPDVVAEHIYRVLCASRPATQVRIQRRFRGRLQYSLLPLLPRRVVDRLVAARIWR